METKYSRGNIFGLSPEKCQSFFSLFAEKSREIVFFSDATGRVVGMNKIAWSFFSQNAESSQVEEDTLPFFQILNLDRQPVPSDQLPLFRAITQRSSVEDNEDYLLLQEDGKTLLCAIAAYPVFGDDSELLGAIAICRDITDQRASESRTEQWRSIVAHDLRGPIVTIDLASRILKDDPIIEGNKELTSIIERICRSTFRLEEMIQNLTDSIVVESKDKRLHKEMVDLRMIISSAIDSANIPPETSLVLQTNKDLKDIYADPEALERVFYNILRNAVLHGNNSGPIEFSATQDENTTVIMIANEGAGIDPQDLPRVFERFFRKRNPDFTGTVGLGLGLFVSKGLTEAHNGRIEVESEQGKKTVFKITLPNEHQSAEPG